jgi:hypothetical protein
VNSLRKAIKAAWEHTERGWYTHPLYGGVVREKDGWWHYPLDNSGPYGPFKTAKAAMEACG